MSFKRAINSRTVQLYISICNNIFSNIVKCNAIDFNKQKSIVQNSFIQVIVQISHLDIVSIFFENNLTRQLSYKYMIKEILCIWRNAHLQIFIFFVIYE